MLLLISFRTMTNTYWDFHSNVSNLFRLQNLSCYIRSELLLIWFLVTSSYLYISWNWWNPTYFSSAENFVSHFIMTILKHNYRVLILESSNSYDSFSRSPPIHYWSKYLQLYMKSPIRRLFSILQLWPEVELSTFTIWSLKVHLHWDSYPMRTLGDGEKNDEGKRVGFIRLSQNRMPLSSTPIRVSSKYYFARGKRLKYLAEEDTSITFSSSSGWGLVQLRCCKARQAASLQR